MMQAPVLPFLTKELGADMATYGKLMTFFSVIQTVGGLLAGPILDAYGWRIVLLASYGSSALCYAMAASAQGMPALYASRVPTLLQHAIMATRTALTETSSEAVRRCCAQSCCAHPRFQDRARVLGYVGVGYGVGMSVGPALGGALSRGSLRSASWVAAVGSLLSLLSLLLFMPSEARGAAAPGGGKRRALSMSDLWRVAALPGVPSLLLVKFLTGMATALFQSAFPLFVNSHFGLDARGSGLVMSFTGCVGIATQALAIDAATRRFEDRRIVGASVAAMLASLAALSAATRVSHLCALLVPLYVASALLSTVNTAQLTKAAPADAGTIVAIDMSVGSATRMLSPSLATMVLQRSGYGSVCGLSASSLVLLLLLLRARLVDAAPHAAPKNA